MVLKKKWSKTEEKFLLEMYGKTSMADICTYLDRSENSVKNKLFVLGITVGGDFEQYEDDFIKEVYDVMPVRIISAKLERSVHAIRARAFELGVN
ncbi:hypothetical protein HUU62_08835 [Rhodoferax sp. 4810]|uniref:Uncharacterized protein n=1 Tax=Thiospirillum jenense TaxID=1653858 RepID=A0A839H8T3_9GAMM|nr:hypothetical protein [Thiospirillum jenense]MBB1074515.1 hypothetical protein [Rhodoferax jenense]MBB1125501.1 hypothetical protein [Thiospirillum jenense]